jgi:hypothetical protein
MLHFKRKTEVAYFLKELLQNEALRTLINPLKNRISSQIIYKNSVRTSQETHYISVAETSRLMLFREKKFAVCCENHVKHTNTFCGQNAEF